MATVPTAPSAPVSQIVTSSSENSGSLAGIALAGSAAQSAGALKPPTQSSNTTQVGAGLYSMYSPANTQAWVMGDDVTGSTQPTSLGYDANATTLVNSTAAYSANAVITDSMGTPTDLAYQMSVFITDLTFDVSIAGTTAQSQLVQDFYPHNFVQGPLTLTGWSTNQNNYGMLCEFIHNCQYKSLTSNSDNWPSYMTQLCLFGRTGEPTGTTTNGKLNASPAVPYTDRGYDGTRTTGRNTTLTRQQSNTQTVRTAYNQTIRGTHDTIVAKGYVQTMPRIHQQFQYAVQWQFQFVVAAMLLGPYRDTPGSVSPQSTWVNMLQDAQTSGVVQFSSAQNKAALAYASSNATSLSYAPDPGTYTPTDTDAGTTPSGTTPSSGTPTTPTGGGGSQGSNGYTNPFSGGWVPGRLDMGYDGTFSGNLVAPFDGTITFAGDQNSAPNPVTDSWGAWIQIEADNALTGLPTNHLYFAEGIGVKCQTGQKVSAGDTLGVPQANSAQNVGPGLIEFGMLPPSSGVGGLLNVYCETVLGAGDDQNSASHAAVLSFSSWTQKNFGIGPPATTDQAGGFYP